MREAAERMSIRRMEGRPRPPVEILLVRKRLCESCSEGIKTRAVPMPLSTPLIQEWVLIFQLILVKNV